MESFFSRFRNVLALVTVLVLQVFALAIQVKRPADPGNPDGPSVRLVRVWLVAVVTPFEQVFTYSGSGLRNVWHSYVDLRGARRENASLKEQLEKLRLEQVRLSEDASQARRLQELLAFKEQFISQTVAAQVIGGGGTERSRVLYIDKGSRDGIQPNMAVITPDGIVGKISRVFPNGTSQVLLINDPLSGAGVMVGESRLRGTLKGTGEPFPEVHNIMSDEKVEKGEVILTSGGDQIFPRGLPIGKVESVGRDNSGDPFFIIKVRPAADLARLEEVLVITHMDERQQQAGDESQRRAADILAERLPTVRPNPANRVSDEPPPTSQLYGPGARKKNTDEPPDTRTLYGTDAHPKNTLGATPNPTASAAKPPVGTNVTTPLAKPAVATTGTAPSAKPVAANGTTGGAKSTAADQKQGGATTTDSKPKLNTSPSSKQPAAPAKPADAPPPGAALEPR